MIKRSIKEGERAEPKGRRAATIADVAALAGTSTASASAVLNSRQQGIRVGAATQERIRHAAAQLGYTPNHVARSLVTGRTGVLGLVFPYSSAFIDENPFCTQVMSGVCQEVIRARYNLMLHTATGDDWNAADASQLIDSRVDGLILVVPLPESPVVERCRQEKFPYVALVYNPTTAEDYAVNAEERVGGRLATEHLIAQGHRRIAHLAGRETVATSGPRQQGYRDALQAAGLSVDPELTVQAGFETGAGYDAMQRLLDLPADRRPTAVFAANDPCAEGAMRAIRERGLRIPEDIAVVGYDDTWFAERMQPRLTSVHMPIREMAVIATRILTAQIEGRVVEDRQPLLPVSLTVRESSQA